MGIKASYRVKNSEGKTTGFIISNHYRKYYDVLMNIDKVDNLYTTVDNVIKSKSGVLEEITVKSINSKEYKRLCDNNPLDRDVYAELEIWRRKWSNYVLYLTGARQIGKTTELLKFAYKNYEQVIYINLANEDMLYNFENFVLKNSIYFGMIDYCMKVGIEQFVDSDNTIIIIDEIQESYKVYNSIRALQGELNCHIAVTGSYLGKTLNSRYFKPAGNTFDIEMLPLSFTEFCRANNEENLLKSIDLYGGSEKEDYIKLTELYKVYSNIGGYPAVVTEYINTKNIENCFDIIGALVSRFTEESASYFKNDKCAVVFENVYKAAFISMAKERRGTSSKDIQDITDFVKLDTKESVSRKEINSAISWLKYSKVIGSCDLYNQGNVMDLLSERRFYFMDCGIARYIAGLTSVPNETVKGIMAENFVYTELYRVYKRKILKGDKPCCSAYGNYELDFMLVDKNDKKYGIEVKAIKSNKHISLDTYLSRGFIDEAYLAEITRGGKGETINSIPIYTVGCRFPYN